MWPTFSSENGIQVVGYPFNFSFITIWKNSISWDFYLLAIRSHDLQTSFEILFMTDFWPDRYRWTYFLSHIAYMIKTVETMYICKTFKTLITVLLQFKGWFLLFFNINSRAYILTQNNSSLVRIWAECLQFGH